MEDDDYACVVCLQIPPGEVHQCMRGHFECIDCWQELQALVKSLRNCPQCRDELPPHPPGNRNIMVEKAIAKLPATCETCGATMTRGQLKEHEVGCRQREQQRVRQEQQRMKRERAERKKQEAEQKKQVCLLYTSPSPRDKRQSRMPSSA